MTDFQPFPKIPRGGEELITITEKLDGTNACVIVDRWYGDDDSIEPIMASPETDRLYITGTQSRKRMITPDDDNYGFAAWVARHPNMAERLGEGYHYGEWYGLGIQKNPNNKTEKVWALFNTERWQDGRQARPEGVECVPLLYEGVWTPDVIEQALDALKLDSLHKGYVPEGVVVWFGKTRRYEKHTYADTLGKWSKK